MVISEGPTRVNSSVFGKTLKAVDSEVFRFRKRRWKEEAKVEGMVRRLAEEIKDDIPPLVAVEFGQIKGPLFKVIEYSLLDFKLYKSERYSNDLAVVYSSEEAVKGSLSDQTLSDRREFREGWLEGLGEKTVNALRKSFRNRKNQVPTFSIISDSRKTLNFTVIPQPTPGTSFDAYLEEIQIMQGRGKEAQRLYARK